MANNIQNIESWGYLTSLLSTYSPLAPRARGSYSSPASSGLGEIFSPSRELYSGAGYGGPASSNLAGFSSAWDPSSYAGNLPNSMAAFEPVYQMALMSAMMGTMLNLAASLGGLKGLSPNNLNNDNYGNNNNNANNVNNNNGDNGNNDKVINNNDGGKGTQTGNKLADFASKWENKSFKPGQTLRCADFVSTMIEQSGAAPPGFKHELSAAGLSKYGKQVGKGDLKPGDMVFFKDTYRPGGFTHVGIYLGNGKFVHRPSSNKPVKVDNLNSGYYAQHYQTARRL